MYCAVALPAPAQDVLCSGLTCARTRCTVQWPYLRPHKMYCAVKDPHGKQCRPHTSVDSSHLQSRELSIARTRFTHARNQSVWFLLLSQFYFPPFLLHCLRG
ncbi:hypothetical protein BaRGS_00024993 [Batillaria attramentaria]|uniref:Secreted protein n=1 Tax=Batillaria attramentaria TaxID=370345 RepID=A0ABD0K9M5_9CAEN